MATLFLPLLGVQVKHLIIDSMGMDHSNRLYFIFQVHMKYGQLIALAVQIVQSYNGDIMTPDSHAEEFLAKQEKMEDTERVFLKQVFYGV